ncbi:MAG: NADH-quinone oxidoreductase subunit L, partial [Phycisphaeraceae bacterium]|nr:NADH-quinone oxidoreductase subunit L [Phycisphaeraceae bacterium]
IPWLPALAAVLCGICCIRKSWRWLAAPISIAGTALAFLVAVLIAPGIEDFDAEKPAANVFELFRWIEVGDFNASFAYLVDPLTLVMLMVVTGIGTLVTVYAAGYMKGDRGYARFFAAVSLFIFAMLSLIMADNLVLLYLGWEGVGLCSYLMIGYYYDRDSAVAAAKKAFIVNRIGDLGFALGIFLTWTTFGTVSLTEVVTQAAGVQDTTLAHQVIPFLLMLGAFGKSAQLPLYVWLPDAMEGPTPVSALIHAATMVTAGVYMIVRLLPLFVLSPAALPTVAVVGGLTALFAATIALCQYDIKRIYAYSTISQLGYMFLGVGAMTAVGGVFHLYTHAFFKALLFLTAGSVMHALAGQLDLRKISGLRRRMPWTCWLMFIGCLALAGFPLTAGFFSKDLILYSVLDQGLGEHGSWLMLLLGIVGLVTAFLTAFYTFRLWFRVFLGPEQWEMGDEHHDDDHGHHDAPHEMGWLMNGPLVVLALGALLTGWLCHDWITDKVQHSTARLALDLHGDKHEYAKGHEGIDLHTLMFWISGTIAIVGILLAAWFHWLNRAAADQLARIYQPVVKLLADKYYVDEIYDATVVTPLRTLGWLFYTLDRLVISTIVFAVGMVPRFLGL